MVARKRRTSSPVIITQKMTAPPQTKWRAWAERVVLAGAVFTAAGIFWNYARPVAETGAPPWPSRSEVQQVAKTLDDRDKADDKLHQDQIDQLRQLADQQQRLADQQRSSAAEALTNRIRNLQSAIDVAKAMAEKDQSLSNQKVLEALQSQMTDLQRQIMETTGK